MVYEIVEILILNDYCSNRSNYDYYNVGKIDSICTRSNERSANDRTKHGRRPVEDIHLTYELTY